MNLLSFGKIMMIRRYTAIKNKNVTEIIYEQRLNTNEGRHFKDTRRPTRAKKGWEFKGWAKALAMPKWRPSMPK